MEDWKSLNESLHLTSEYWVEEPSLKQRLFLMSTHREVLFGGAAGGGKSSALLMAALQYADIPGYSAILFRRTFADLALPGALMDRFKDWVGAFPEIRWNENNYQAVFPSGARITFGYLNNSRDYERYRGSEYQFAGFDEVTDIRESDYVFISSRLRQPASGPLSQVPIRMRCTANPAPNWVRQRFIVEGETHPDRLFIPSSLEDNPGINIATYRESLAALDPVERKRLEFGDWWATNLGSMFKREDFVVVEPQELPNFNKTTEWVRFWDMAGTEVSNSNPDPDWTVGVLAAFHEGICYIMDVVRYRLAGERLEEKLRETASYDGAETPIRIEQEPGSAGKNLLSQYSRFTFPGMDFQGTRATGDKQTRAKPLASAVANGNVRLLMAAWNTDFIDELTAFPEGQVHDDQVDAAAHAFNHVAGLGGGLRQKVQIIV